MPHFETDPTTYKVWVRHFECITDPEGLPTLVLHRYLYPWDGVGYAKDAGGNLLPYKRTNGDDVVRSCTVEDMTETVVINGVTLTHAEVLEAVAMVVDKCLVQDDLQEAVA